MKNLSPWSWNSILRNVVGKQRVLIALMSFFFYSSLLRLAEWTPASKTKHPATYCDGAFPHIYVRSGYILGAAANIKLKIKKRI